MVVVSLLTIESNVGEGEVAKLQVVLLVLLDFPKTGHFMYVCMLLLWVGL